MSKNQDKRERKRKQAAKRMALSLKRELDGGKSELEEAQAKFRASRDGKSGSSLYR